MHFIYLHLLTCSIITLCHYDSTFCAYLQISVLKFGVDDIWVNRMTFICIECDAKADLLYSHFPGSNNIRIEHCKKCGQLVDSYVEYDVSLIFLDLMLLSKPVWRHVLFNEETKFLPIKLAVICLFCDGYMKWATAAQSDQEGIEKWNDTDIVFQAVVQIQLYIFTLVSGLELLAFLFLCVAFSYAFRPMMVKTNQSDLETPSVCKILRCLLLAATGKFLYIPAIIWLQADSPIYLQLILLYMLVCSALAFSLTVNCSFFQSFMIVSYSFYLSILLIKPIGELLYQLDLHRLTS